MSSNLMRLLLVIPWLGAVYGTLQLHQLDLNLGHGICGPWGCGPPTEALFGYHSFWTVMIVPPAILIGLYLPASWNQKIGFCLVLVGTAVTLGYVLVDVWTYTSESGSWQFAMQRGFFAWATAIDFPMVQIALAGLALVGVALLQKVRDPVRAQAETSSALPRSGVVDVGPL